MVMIQGESLGQRAGTLPPPPDQISLLDAPDDDDMLLARLRAGDDSAVRALVDRHRPWLVRLCTRLLGYDAHAAEDAAQESLLKLLAAARRDGRPLRVRPWLTVVARNTCVDQQRRRRPELPGDLPERATTHDEGLEDDGALSEAWTRLSGRHREVLYLREVMGFSYKEIGSVMGLTMPATETLVFRARAALKREYERSGGTSFGSGLLGLRLARLGLGRRRDVAVPDGVANAAASDPGFGNLTSRLAQWVSTALPGGEQAIVKALSVAAGVAMAAAATVIPGLSSFADGPAGAASASPVAATSGAGAATGAAQAAALAGAAAPSSAVSLKALLGNGVPSDWTPQRSRTGGGAAVSSTPTQPAPTGSPGQVTPLRDAAQAAKSADRPRLRHPAGDDGDPGPLRSILTDRPGPAGSTDRPHPLRALLADPVPMLIDALPAEPVMDALPVDVPTTEPAPVEPAPVEPAPAGEPSTPQDPTPGDRPTPVRDAAQQGREVLPPGEGNVAGHDADLLRRGDG